MLVSIFLALFLPCAGMSAVFVVYMCLLWFSSGGDPTRPNPNPSDPPLKPAKKEGLTVAELEKLPKVNGKELVLGSDCAVCLDEIESNQEARLVPGCNHGFHIECADTWLKKHNVCPICRTKLDTEFFDSNQSPC